MRIAYDATLMKPGCVLLQSVMGGTQGIAERFDTEHWLLAPTPDLKLYEITAPQLDQLITKTRETHGNVHPR